MPNKTEFPTLYHKASKGDLRVWRVWAEGNKLYTSYGVDGGQIQTSCKEVEGKNIGRSNETTPAQQALQEAQSLWDHKVTRKYSTTKKEAQLELTLPMLAKDYKANKVKYPCYGQPKLDGVRALSYWEDDKVILLSRAGREYTVPTHINVALQKFLPKGDTLDGEIYIHGKSCQSITSLVKKSREGTELLEYHIYDYPVVSNEENLPFSKRLEALLKLSKRNQNSSIKFVETESLKSFQELQDLATKHVEAGYEGSIIRNKDGVYKWGYRSQDLMKYKQFEDHEFKVIDIRDGVGKFSGCAVFICQNDLNEETFDCTMATSMEEKAEQYKNKDILIGKMLTVKHFGRTEALVPRFPVAKLFRDEKDLS